MLFRSNEFRQPIICLPLQILLTMSFEFIPFLFKLTPNLDNLGVNCSPRDPRFAGSTPADIDGFFSERKNPEHKSSGRDFILGVPSLRFQVR